MSRRLQKKPFHSGSIVLRGMKCELNIWNLRSQQCAMLERRLRTRKICSVYGIKWSKCFVLYWEGEATISLRFVDNSCVFSIIMLCLYVFCVFTERATNSWIIWEKVRVKSDNIEKLVYMWFIMQRLSPSAHCCVSLRQ